MFWEIIVEIRDILESTQRISEMVNHKSQVEVFRTEEKDKHNLDQINKSMISNSDLILDQINDNHNPQMNNASKLDFKLTSQTCISIDSDYLFPGDIVKITTNAVIPADIIIIEGKCVVSEAMLTGESIPLVKDAIHADN